MSGSSESYQWLIGVGITIGLGLLTYLISGLIGWGKASAALAANTDITNAIKKDLSDMRSEMLRPSDLKLAIAQMELSLTHIYFTKVEAEGLERRIMAAAAAAAATAATTAILNRVDDAGKKNRDQKFQRTG